VRTRNLKIIFFISGHAVPPINNSIVARINRGFHHGVRNITAKRIDEIACAAPRIAIGKNTAAVLLEDAQPDSVRRLENRLAGYGPAERRRQRDHRRDIFWPLMRHRSRNHTTQAVAYEMNLPPGLRSRPRDRLVQMSLDEKIGTIGIDSDAREVRLVTDSPKPAVEFHQIEIRPKKPGDDHDARGVTGRDSQAVIDGGSVQQENLSREQGFRPR